MWNIYIVSQIYSQSSNIEDTNATSYKAEGVFSKSMVNTARCRPYSNKS
jgi:hypothetical protein